MGPLGCPPVSASLIPLSFISAVIQPCVLHSESISCVYRRRWCRTVLYRSSYLPYQKTLGASWAVWVSVGTPSVFWAIRSCSGCDVHIIRSCSVSIIRTHQDSDLISGPDPVLMAVSSSGPDPGQMALLGLSHALRAIGTDYTAADMLFSRIVVSLD